MPYPLTGTVIKLGSGAWFVDDETAGTETMPCDDPGLEPLDRAELQRRRDTYLAELARIAMAVDEVELERVSAPEQFHNIYHTAVRPLAQKVGTWGQEAGMRKPE